jgi:uncharacterized pyridoxamine 5'-phosphate oxidase family protein
LNFKDCIDFANENALCHLATTEDDQPHLRVMRMWNASEDGFYFCGLAPKNMWNQMKTNPKVEICFFNNASEPSGIKVLRIKGEVEFLEDLEMKKEILEKRPMYKTHGTGQPDDPTYPLMRVAHGEAWFWTRQYILKESEAERIKF